MSWTKLKRSIAAKSGWWPYSPFVSVCRYFFTFNGDGYIATDRRWNPDAVDPSFALEAYTNTAITQNSFMFTQSMAGATNTRELSFSTSPTGVTTIYLGGLSYPAFDAIDAGLAMWRLEYLSSTSQIKTYKNGTLIKTVNAVIVGGAREPLSGKCNYGYRRAK